MPRTSALMSFVATPIVLATLAATSHAQIGSGWSAYTPTMRLQLRGCGAHSSSGGVETFRLTCSDTSNDNRAEQRIENDYTSGTNQFEGEVRVVSLGGSNISLKQTFRPNDGAFLMIAVGSGGRLFSVGGPSGDLATGIIGSWIRLNTIHSVSAGTHQIYINGSLRATKTGAPQTAWHDKYGTYRLGSGQGPITAEWRNVRFWRGGSSSGGSPTPTPTPTPTPVIGATATPTPTSIPGGGGTWEAESLSPVGSGATTAMQSDASATGGTWLALQADGPGDYLQLTIPSLSAGSYSVSLRYKAHPNRGILQASVDGGNVGSTLDQYAATAAFMSRTFGTVSLGAGTHTLRLTVTGRNSAAGAYTLSADTVTFSLVSTPPPTPTPTTPVTATPTPTATPCTDCSSGFYRLMARHSGKALVVSNASTAENATVVQWTYGGTSSNDEWGLEALGTGYHRIVNRNSGKSMSVAGASTAAGALITQRTYTGAAATTGCSRTSAPATSA
jgi:ricin-type beta-trefoil lectin protein